MPRDPVLSFTDRGIHCPDGGFYIDPWRPVDSALITHGHSDHARSGHGRYLATDEALPVMRHRLGGIDASGVAFGEARRIGGVTVSFHPAGHVPGSAQIRVERDGEVWVVSGDYKTTPDGLSEPWEPVPCHAFITECTFGLPVYHWPAQDDVTKSIVRWWAGNAAEGKVSLLGAYGLGKAQRIMAMVARAGANGPIFTHGAVEATTAILRDQGYALPATTRVSPEDRPPAGALVISPPSALGSAWASRLGPRAEAFASGWMALRGVRRRRGPGTGFVLSDHADWEGLNAAIRATGATRIFATHGYTGPFCRWLSHEGYEAGVVATEWSGEAAEAEAEAPDPGAGSA